MIKGLSNRVEVNLYVLHTLMVDGVNSNMDDANVVII
jgi:hypothetical protein